MAHNVPRAADVPRKPPKIKLTTEAFCGARGMWECRKQFINWKSIWSYFFILSILQKIFSGMTEQLHACYALWHAAMNAQKIAIPGAVMTKYLIEPFSQRTDLSLLANKMMFFKDISQFFHGRNMIHWKNTITIYISINLWKHHDQNISFVVEKYSQFSTNFWQNISDSKIKVPIFT